jgi:hypothetical protein
MPTARLKPDAKAVGPRLDPSFAPAKPRPSIGNQAHLRRLRGNGRPLQAKLTVGAVNDPLEHEADAAADRVMRMGDPGLGASTAPPRLTRKCDTCEDDQKPAIQAKCGDDRLKDGGEAPDGVEAALNAPGRPLDPADRDFFEPRFGRDFSQVRVHTDGAAARANRQLGAQAFTFGSHVFFAEGNAPRRDFLTGHELAHVVQQGAAPTVDGASAPQPDAGGTAQRQIQRLPGDGMSPPGDCDWTDYIPLRIAKETAVAIAEGLGGCAPGDSCPRLAFKIAALGAEIAARVAIAVRCFRGGDTGHVQQINVKTRALDNCLALFSRSNCSPDLVTEMRFVVERLRALLATLFVVVAVAAIIALIVLLVVAIAALIEVIAAAIAAAAEAVVTAGALAAFGALLLLLSSSLSSDDSET